MNDITQDELQSEVDRTNFLLDLFDCDERIVAEMEGDRAKLSEYKLSDTNRKQREIVHGYLWYCAIELHSRWNDILDNQ